MDVTEYLPMFLAEGREHLQELNLAVVRIEEQPDDPRHGRRDLPHRALAEGHERDDGLRRHGGPHARDGGRVRAAAPAQGRARPRSRRRAARCLDALGEAVDAIEADGGERIVPEPLIAELRGLVRDRTPEQAADRTGDADRRAAPPPTPWSTGAWSASTSSSRPTSRCRPCAPTWSCPRSPRRASWSPPRPRTSTSRRSTAASSHAWLATEEAEADRSALAGAVPEVAAVQVAVEADRRRSSARPPPRRRPPRASRGPRRPSASTPSGSTS